MVIRIPKLPAELIEEILARLPVKSLLRFRSVSKSWWSLISSKDFVKAHIEISSKDTSFSIHRIIITTYFNTRKISSCGILPLNNTRSCAVSLLHCQNTSSFGMDLDFGYDDCSDDYKVFGILCLSDDYYAVHGVSKVYSLKMDSWRKLDDITTNLPDDLQGQLACNNLSWIRSNEKDSEGKWDILSFDLDREVIGMVDVPGSMDFLCGPSLDELKGCLCLLCQYLLSGRLDVWMLKQYGVKESWNKMLSINFPCFPNPNPVSKHCRISGPLWVGSNGDILLLFCESRFVFYNPKDDRWFSKDDRSHACFSNLEYVKKVNVYVESLVSPCVHRGVGT